MAQDANATQNRIELSEVREQIILLFDQFYLLKECIQNLHTAKQIATAHVQPNSHPEILLLSEIDISQFLNLKPKLVQVTPLMFQNFMKPIMEIFCKEFQIQNQSPSQVWH